jgi:hypothetical protein
MRRPIDVKAQKAGGHVGAMTGAMVATAIVFFPAAPLFLFMKRKDITIPQGTEITAYTSGDIPLDASKFAPDSALNVAAPKLSPTGTETALSVIEIKSTPDEAEITVDDKYFGSTPSTLHLARGITKLSWKSLDLKPGKKSCRELAVTVPP